jgi:hypothetical protein
VSMPSEHYFRLEISGPHSGGAFRYHSAIFGTLAEVETAVIEEFQAQDGVAFLVAEEASLMLEYYEDGALRGEWNLFPSVTLGLPKGKSLAFTPSGDIVGVKVDDSEALFEHPVVGPVLEGEVEANPVVNFTALKLPQPRGKPLKAGRAIAYVRDGKPHKQAYGMVGDWDAPGFKPRKVPRAS